MMLAVYCELLFLASSALLQSSVLSCFFAPGNNRECGFFSIAAGEFQISFVCLFVCLAFRCLAPCGWQHLLIECLLSDQPIGGCPGPEAGK